MKKLMLAILFLLSIAGASTPAPATVQHVIKSYDLRYGIKEVDGSLKFVIRMSGSGTALGVIEQKHNPGAYNAWMGLLNQAASYGVRHSYLGNTANIKTDGTFQHKGRFYKSFYEVILTVSNDNEKKVSEVSLKKVHQSWNNLAHWGAWEVGEGSHLDYPPN